ncbi:hypothetical protein CXB51_008987 [Gossypium anomalum]|uniref:Integrase catalytic domain-containing protein n=1 Tax=Gossypium anomalum TaxID=47600 RepID=A0A8J5ZIF9_9ROSI|nr:hypothetical protein CXB51_008987 [Gossypium anomalum]
MDLEDALLEIDKMPSTLTDEEKKRKDRKALTQLHLHLSNEILQDVMKEKTAAALWKRLEQICMSKTLTMFKEILSNLEAMEIQYDKEDLGLILLCSLPPSYSTFRDTILYSRESLTVDEIGILIMIVEGHRNRILTNKVKREAADQKGKQPENSGEADVVEDYSDGELLVASVNDSKVREKWILDSSCTFHMSPNRDWFTTYETVSEGVVLIENNASCKIAGYRYTAESGVLKISKGSLVVMKGQRKTAKLYVLQGSTVTGDAAIISSFLSDDDITKLWHMRLGLMSENGMVELSKRGLLDGGHPECLRETGKQIKYLRTDNGLEFCSDEFNRLYKSEGIMRHLTVCHTPQQNGIAERMNRTIMEKVRCMLSNANLPKSFWAEAAFTVCFLINRSPSVAIEKKTPQEVWSGNPANYSDLKIFWCPAYANVDNGKLEPRAIKCVFFGYKAGVKGYKLWCPENRKVVISRDVVFYETAMLPNVSLKDSSNKENQKQVKHQINTESTPQASTKIENRVACSLQYSIAKNRTRREIKPPKKYAEADLVTYALNRRWNHSTKTKTWDLVKLPKGKKTVRCKWMFKKKEGTSEVKEPRYKARLVAKGYSQIPRVDFIDVFSLVLKHSSIRALLGFVAMHDLELEQLDVKTVFWYGKLEEDIYMQQSKGFTVSEKEDYVCLLKKSLLRLETVTKAVVQESAKPVSTPLAAHFRLSSALSPQSDDEIEYMSHVPYFSAVGSLMYAMVCSRPDLLYAVSAISRYIANPGKEHWKAVQWILSYLRGTTDVCLQFGRNEDRVIGYVDADFAGDLDRIRSLTGYVFTIGGCAISWKTTLQTTVALSTTEAEYMVITEACKEAIWLKGLFSELNEDLQISTVFCDSQSAIFLTKDQMFHERTKHILFMILLLVVILL